MIPVCTGCGRAHWYPRPFCPFCASEAVVWQQASSGGRVYAFSALARDAAPGILAYVQLDEGPVMMTNLVNCALDALAIGERVTVRFQATPHGRCVPVFSPARSP